MHTLYHRRLFFKLIGNYSIIKSWELGKKRKKGQEKKRKEDIKVDESR